MLRLLHIENIAVIRCADLELCDGFTVLTGETGAGKSILIDSVNLLLGGKFSREILRSGETRAVVSGVFDSLSAEETEALAALGFVPDDDGVILLQRTLLADGKSTLRLNGQPLTAAMAREVGRNLLNIHGQNDNQKLLQKAAHLRILDAMGDYADELAAYERVWGELRACERSLAESERSDAEKLRLREMLTYQIKDIEAAKLKADEEETLTRERDRLKNLEKITKYVNYAAEVLDSREKNGAAAYLLGRGTAALRQITDVIPEAEDVSGQLEDMMYRIRDLAETVRTWADEDATDPTARLDAIEGRLELISRLKRKYGATVGDVLAFAEHARAELETLETAQERGEALRETCRALTEDCRARAASLTDKRRAVAERLTERVRAELAFLDMPGVRFAVSIRPSDGFLPTGCDDVEFLIATNPGEALMPMIKIASGGELSRLMLALKSVLNDRDGVGTVIFDEIDTGISGKTSRKVGMRLAAMGKKWQVLCITHAAQVASLADHHVLISKAEADGRAETSLRVLDESERTEEVARILGGIEITEAQRRAAAEMLSERGNI